MRVFRASSIDLDWHLRQCVIVRGQRILRICSVAEASDRKTCQLEKWPARLHETCSCSGHVPLSLEGPLVWNRVYGFVLSF